MTIMLQRQDITLRRGEFVALSLRLLMSYFLTFKNHIFLQILYYYQHFINLKVRVYYHKR